MTTEELDGLKSILKWIDEILKKAESLDNALHKADMIIESCLVKLSLDRLDYVSHRVEQKILENQ